MDLESITPLILTYNEEPNLPRVLAKLSWAKSVVVIDSGSTDRTLAIAAEHPNVRVVSRLFDEHASQWNFGIDQVSTSWVLSLDADYVISDELIDEMAQLSDSGQSGFVASFRYCVAGRPLRGSLYPPRVILFRPDRARYVSDGHTQLLEIAGSVTPLRGIVFHDDRKPLDAWLRAQVRYSALERTKLESSPDESLAFVDRLRLRAWPAPLLTPFYCLFVKGLILDGRPGLFYTLQRTYAELLLALYLRDSRLSRSLARNQHPEPAASATSGSAR